MAKKDLMLWRIKMFEAGDKVRAVADILMSDMFFDGDDTVAVSAGTEGEILALIAGMPLVRFSGVEIRGGDIFCYKRSRLELVESKELAGEPFKTGDRVRITEDIFTRDMFNFYDEDELLVPKGTVGTVVKCADMKNTWVSIPEYLIRGDDRWCYKNRHLELVEVDDGPGREEGREGEVSLAEA
jgi:hypothetical protein